MKLLVCASLFVSSFTFVYPLCTSPQWEGILQSTTSYLNVKKGRYGLLEEYTAVHYDYKNKRSSLQKSTVESGKNNAFYNIVTIYKDGTGIRYTAKYYPYPPHCVKEYLSKPFEEKCVPDGATPAGNFFFGGAGVFEVNAYEAFSSDYSTFYVVSESDDQSMVPVMETVKGTIGDYEIFQSSIYKNITAGIKTESVFNIPYGCEKGQSDLLWRNEDEYPLKEHSMFRV